MENLNPNEIDQAFGKCLRCGYCCMTAFFALTDIPADDDKQEIGRWIQCHGCEPMRYPSKDGKEDVLAVKIPIVCQHLEQNDGVYGCKIHSTRPKVCQNYFCKRAQDEVVKDLVNTESIKNLLNSN